RIASRYSGVVCSGARVRPPRESSVSMTNVSPGSTRATGGNRRSNTGVSLSRVMRCMREELVSHTNQAVAGCETCSMMEVFMKTHIAQVEVIPIRAPRKESVRSGLNPRDPVSASEFGIIRILTESGLEGLGEISITFPRIGHSLCHAAAGLIAPALIGRDCLARPQVLAEIDRLLAGELSAPYLRAAFEMALLDLAGKHYGVPAYELLGGRMRERVALA